MPNPLPSDRPDADSLPALIYIGGTMRSGTTLLSELLAETSGVVTVGESSGTWAALARGSDLCGCGLPAHSCPFWTLVLTHLHDELPGFGAAAAAELVARVGRTRRWQFLRPVPAIASLMSRDDRRYVELHGALLRAVAAASGAQVVVDSSKMPPTLRAYQWVPGLRLAVIQIVRDPRAVAHSESASLRREPRPGRNDPPGKTAPRSAFMWMAVNISVRLACRRSDPYLLVRYEELCRETESTLGRILDTCGVAVPESGPGPGRQHILVGNPSRFGQVRRPLRVDEKWRREFDPTLGRWIRRATRPVDLMLERRRGWLAPDPAGVGG